MKKVVERCRKVIDYIVILVHVIMISMKEQILHFKMLPSYFCFSYSICYHWLSSHVYTWFFITLLAVFFFFSFYYFPYGTIRISSSNFFLSSYSFLFSFCRHAYEDITSSDIKRNCTIYRNDYNKYTRSYKWTRTLFRIKLCCGGTFGASTAKFDSK